MVIIASNKIANLSTSHPSEIRHFVMLKYLLKRVKHEIMNIHMLVGYCQISSTFHH